MGKGGALGRARAAATTKAGGAARGRRTREGTLVGAVLAHDCGDAALVR
jgi:hypothetical protein